MLQTKLRLYSPGLNYNFFFSAGSLTLSIGKSTALVSVGMTACGLQSSLHMEKKVTQLDRFCLSNH
jgi:hypothetical protein